MKEIMLAHIDHELVTKEIGRFVVDRAIKAGTVGGVIGLSGGVDSTTTAALAKKAFDHYNSSHPERLELVGYILPSKTNAKEDEEDGIKVAKRLGIRYEIKNIESVVEAYKHTNPEAFESKYDKGNLMSRIRANILSTKAATEKKVVLGTGNRDEDFSIGYYTLFGDGAVHLSPIGGLPKRIVRQLAGYLGFKDLADRTPTAGLEPGQTDFKDIGYDYDLVELLTEGMIQGFSFNELSRHPQVASLAEKHIYYYEKEFGQKKFSNVEEIIGDFAMRNNIAKAKSEIIHPPLAKVTLNYSGGEK